MLESVGMDSTAIQEIRWPGNDYVKTGNFTVFYNGNNQDKHVFGTGFVVKVNLLNSLIEFHPINKRLCWLRLRGNGITTTEEKTEEEKDIFHQQLEHLIDSLPRQDMLFLSISRGNQCKNWKRRRFQINHWKP